MTEPIPSHQRYGGNSGETSLSGYLKFELKSLLGRAFSPRRRTPKQPLIQIGSGMNPLPQFENIDFYYARFWKSQHVGHDLRYPLPYEANTFEGAYSEHTLEHLYTRQAIQLIHEIYRVLKRGAVFRVSVPDLEKYVQFYNGQSPNKEFEAFDSGCEAIWTLTQNHTHLAVYDFEMMSRQLKAAGFKTITRRQFREGADPRLLVDKPSREWESLYIEAVK